MKASRARWCVLVLLLAGGPLSFAEQPCRWQSKPCLQISVRLYDYAKVRGRDLAAAKHKAARIMRRAGIETVWVDCVFTSDAASKNPACNARVSPTDIVLRILSSSHVPPWAHETGLFGYALPAKGAEFGALANVFHHRVEELLAELRVFPAGGIFNSSFILGHLMAHEVGHLLLGANSHSLNGIMQFPWDRKVLQLSARGALLFTRRQAKRMQTQVARRHQAKASPPARARNEARE